MPRLVHAYSLRYHLDIIDASIESLALLLELYEADDPRAPAWRLQISTAKRAALSLRAVIDGRSSG